LKENIEVIEDALNKVQKLRGVKFNRKDLPSNEKFIGLIAQELEQVLPEAVVHNNNGIKSISYGNIIALVIEAIKEQQVLITNLQNDIAKIKNTL